MLLLGLLVSSFALVSTRVVLLTKGNTHLVTVGGLANLTTMDAHIHVADLKFGMNELNIERHLGLNGSASSAPRRRKRQSSATSLTTHSGMLWSGPVSIGTPAKTFVADWDTGSTDSVFCGSVSCSNGGTRRIYQSSTSSTALVSQNTFSDAYGDGSVSNGVTVRDLVSFGPAQLAVAHGLSIASELGGVLLTFPADGSAFLSDYESVRSESDVPSFLRLMGMAFPPLSSTGLNSFVTDLAQRHKVIINEFAFRLSDTPGVSELFIGGYNPSKFTGPITYYPMSTDPRYGGLYTYLQLANSVANVNGYPVTGTRSIYLIDTGTTLIIAPLAQAQAFWAAVPSAKPLSGNWAGYWSYNCAATLFVSLSFAGSAQRHPIAPSDFSIGLAPGSATRCVGALVGADIGVGAAWVIGDVFLKNQYTIFNVNGKKIGFATPV